MSTDGSEILQKNEELMGTIKNEISNYITKLWTGIRTRLDEADRRELNCIPFSEAPEEGVFSVSERVISGRESMTLAHANTLLRISKLGVNQLTRYPKGSRV